MTNVCGFLSVTVFKQVKPHVIIGVNTPLEFIPQLYKHHILLISFFKADTRSLQTFKASFAQHICYEVVCQTMATSVARLEVAVT